MATRRRKKIPQRTGQYRGLQQNQQIPPGIERCPCKPTSGHALSMPRIRQRRTMQSTDTNFPVEGETAAPKKRKASSRSEVNQKKAKLKSESSKRTLSSSPEDELYDVTRYQVNTNKDDFLSKYIQLCKLGSGGFGCVSAGIRLDDALPVAIKRIPRENVVYKKIVQKGVEYNIIEEVALMLKAAQGPGSAVVPLVECYELSDEVITVMERPYPAIDLFHYREARDGVLQEWEAKCILKQTVEAAADMHNNGVFHRDIKVENILIETDHVYPKVRVIDFGCGCLVKEGTYDYYSGTFCKAPPEWFSCKEYRAMPTTVFHLGTLLYDILHEESFDTRLYLKRQRRLDMGLSNDCLNFLKRCLCRDPKRRPTFEELQHHPWLNF